MSDKYQIQRNVTADGKPFEAGQVVSRDDVPASCFESMLRVGHMVPHVEPSPESPSSGQPAADAAKPDADKPDKPNEPDEPEKKKRGRPAGSGKKKPEPKGDEPKGDEPDAPEASDQPDRPDEQGDAPESETPAEIPAGI